MSVCVRSQLLHALSYIIALLRSRGPAPLRRGLDRESMHYYATIAASERSGSYWKFAGSIGLGMSS